MSKTSRSRTLNVGGTDIDVGAFDASLVELGATLSVAQKNPFSALAMRRVAAAQKGVLNSFSQLPARGQQLMAPLATVTKQAMTASNAAIQLRVAAAARLARRPSIPVPISISIANATSSTEVTITNPYLGNSTTGYWAISGLSTGPLSTCSGMRFTKFQFASINYASDALSGVSFAGAETGKATTPGIPFHIFASDAFKQDGQDWRPWNLGGDSVAVMTDVANAKLVFRNESGAAYVGDIVVYVQASPCGAPHLRQEVRNMFAPSRAALQKARITLASGWPDIESQFGNDL